MGDGKGEGKCAWFVQRGRKLCVGREGGEKVIFLYIVMQHLERRERERERERERVCGLIICSFDFHA